MSTLPVDGVESVTFKAITIDSEKLPMKVDITEGVSNIDIYEHMDKPYLTGAIAFSDTKDIIASMDIGGGEKITIELQSTRDNSKPISKTFYLDTIVGSSKLGDNTEFFVLHLIEDIGYISNLKNINRAYSDNPSNIIKNVAKDFLDKELETSGTGQKNMKVIVPNLNPIETMSWIKNMACTAEGYPFYLLSSLVKDKLTFVDLKTLLTSGSMNPDVPFSYGQATMSINSPLLPSHRRVIKNYNFANTENLFALIQKGLVGAKYKYLDPTHKHNEDNEFVFDIQKDVMGLLDTLPDANSPHYSDIYKVEGKSFNEFPSRSITQVGSTEAYEKGKSYQQSQDGAHYKLNIINRSIDHLMKKNPLTMTVNGIDFLGGTNHLTTGRKIAVRFMRNMAPEDTDYFFDNKKSGDFLIFSAKHSFDRETYTVSLSCLKLFDGKL